MTDYGECLRPGTVRFVRDLPGPIQRVWDHLVDSDLKAKWFCAGATEARVGGRVEMHFDHARLSPEPDDRPLPKYADMPARSSFSGEVTAYEPPHRLAFTWVEEGEHSHVTFELDERGDHVRLTLTHENLRSRDELVGACGGWHTHLDILHDVLTGIVPAPFWRRYAPIDAEYEMRLDP